MTTKQLKSRITELEAEVARLKDQIPSKKSWWDKIAGTFADDKDFDKAMWYGRQWRHSFHDLPQSKTAPLRRQYRDIIVQVRKLAPFKTNVSAAEYVHREFSPR
jgi:hypothetical protein